MTSNNFLHFGSKCHYQVRSLYRNRAHNVWQSYQNVFLFPHDIILGGTSGVAVILNHLFSFSAAIGSGLIAVASGILFYVNSSSGGTDIIALIIQKYSSLHIGRCLFLTDILIVAIGCIWSDSKVIIASIVGFLIKVFGIDFIMNRINKILIRKALIERRNEA